MPQLNLPQLSLTVRSQFPPPNYTFIFSISIPYSSPMPRNFVFVKFLPPDRGTALRPCFYMCDQCNAVNCLFPPPPPPPPPPFHKTQTTPTVLIVILSVLSIVILFVSCLMFTSCRNFRRRNVEAAAAIREDGNQAAGGLFDHHVWYIRTDGLSQSLIDSITAFDFKQGLIDGPDCAVCLNEFQVGERLRLLPKCSHAFHVTCIDTWLRSHQNCPVCRAPILVGETPAGNSVIEPDVLDTGESEEASGNDPGLGIQGDSSSEILRIVSDLDDQGLKLEPVRRSMSMDFSSRRGCNCSLVKSYSYGRGPVSMKRSFSFTGKRLPVRKAINRSHESISLHEISIGNPSQQ